MNLIFKKKEKLEPIGPTRKPIKSNAVYDLTLMKSIFRTTTQKCHLKSGSKNPDGHMELSMCIVKPSVKKPSSKYKKHRFV